MKTITLKLPQALDMQLVTFAQKKGLSRSEIVRQALAAYFVRSHSIPSGTFLDLAQDLAGSLDGPPDLSANKSYLEGYGGK